MVKNDNEFAPTVGGNTGMVYTKKQLAIKKAREKKMADALKAWRNKPNQKVKCLTSVGGIHQDHPKEKPFGGSEGQVIIIKKADADMLVKAGLAEEVK